jgi:hypothetical protein
LIFAVENALLSTPGPMIWMGCVGVPDTPIVSGVYVPADSVRVSPGSNELIRVCALLGLAT